jgi:DNA repair photolyase
MSAPVVVEQRVKSVLNRVKGMPFRWSINPYRGCAHGCVFCYARRTHWYIEEDGVNDWATKIFAKVNAPEVLRAELSRPSWMREEVALGTATDPYQPAEKRYKISRAILEALRDYRTPVGIVTRSPMILRDLDLLTDLTARAGARVCVSIATVDPVVARDIEPTVSLPKHRLALVRKLREAGIHAGVFIAPVLPRITDSFESIAAVFGAALEAGASFVHHSALYLGPVTRDAFFEFLHRKRPWLVEYYREMYRGIYVSRPYDERLDATASAARERSGFLGAPAPLRVRGPEQMRLWE